MFITPQGRALHEASKVVFLQASRENNSNLVVYIAAFFLTTLGIVYVQEAERRIPMNYAKRSRSNLNTQSYLPFKVTLFSGFLLLLVCIALCFPSELRAALKPYERMPFRCQAVFLTSLATAGVLGAGGGAQL